MCLCLRDGKDGKYTGESYVGAAMKVPANLIMKTIFLSKLNPWRVFLAANPGINSGYRAWVFIILHATLLSAAFLQGLSLLGAFETRNCLYAVLNAVISIVAQLSR